MAQVNKIDSNITGLVYAEEAIIGVLPGEQGQGGSPVWKRLNPNSYSDFGGEVITVAPNPINPSRQRRRGVITDLDASGGFNHNLTFHNLLDLMQGPMFADIREKGFEEPATVDATDFLVAETAGFFVGTLLKGKGFDDAGNNALQVVTAIVADTSIACDATVVDGAPAAGANIRAVGFEGVAGDIDVVVTGPLPVLETTSLDWTTLGLVVGQWIYVGGDQASEAYTNSENNGWKRIRAIAATALTIDKSDETMVVEVSTTETIRVFFGDVLRNETGALIKRRTYNFERELGAPDDASPNDVQTELLIGASVNEVTFNVPSADLASVDMTLVAIDNIQRTGPTGPKATAIQVFDSADEFNTSSDIARIKLAAVSDVDEAPADLFAFVTEASIVINNNISPNKAVGILGAFDVTAGTFTVSGSLTAYFSNVSGVVAVRNNDQITLDLTFLKDQQAIVLDIPLIGLGDGRLSVELDQPITLPLNTDASSGEDVTSLMDHTLLFTFFHYLPLAAS